MSDKEDNNSESTDTSDKEPEQPSKSDSQPSEEIEAPQSDWFKRSIDDDLKK